MRLSGLDVSDSTLKLIIKHMPLLRRLDLSHCPVLTDQSISLLTAIGSNARSTLREVTLTGILISYMQPQSHCGKVGLTFKVLNFEVSVDH